MTGLKVMVLMYRPALPLMLTDPVSQVRPATSRIHPYSILVLVSAISDRQGG